MGPRRSRARTRPALSPDRGSVPPSATVCEPPTRSGTLKVFWLGVLTGVGLLITACVPLGPTPPPPELSFLSFEELRERASSPTYDDLFRNNDQYLGQLVYYQAQLVQVIDVGKDRYQIRANVTEGQFFWEDTVFLRYGGPRLLEKDIIEFVGTVAGLTTYTAVLGNRVTIPDINIIEAKLRSAE